MVMPKVSWSHITCGEACWRAKESECKCSCGGKNHGIWLRGGVAERTHKHNGKMYKLVAVDSYRNIDQLQKELLEGYGLMRCYEYGGKYYHQTYRHYFTCRGDKDTLHFPVVAKKPSLSQCQRWTELASYKNISKIDWWRLDVLLLWEIIEKPAPVVHVCTGQVIEKY